MYLLENTQHLKIHKESTVCHNFTSRGNHFYVYATRMSPMKTYLYTQINIFYAQTHRPKLTSLFLLATEDFTQ